MLKVLTSSLVVQVGISSMATSNCSKLGFSEHPALNSSFRLKSSFLKREDERHLLQVFSFAIPFP
ncbi:unnamed protein product [Hymenolepis diminuta]|uniref:Uncharacterized protein n=1 Tax=Hymenolepis diminuta TaxID=6216 RepID=A0A564YAQ8_HYMDI|nr:unnamed protein product [Hymenolepis diminuta]